MQLLPTGTSILAKEAAVGKDTDGGGPKYKIDLRASTTNLCRPFFFATANTPTSQRLSKPSDKTPQAKSLFTKST